MMANICNYECIIPGRRLDPREISFLLYSSTSLGGLCKQQNLLLTEATLGPTLFSGSK